MFSSSASDHLERNGRHSTAWSHLPDPIALFDGPCTTTLFFRHPAMDSSSPTSVATASSSNDDSSPTTKTSHVTVSSDDDDSSSSPASKRNDLTDGEREEVLRFLLQRTLVTQRLKRGALAEAATRFDVSTRTCKRIIHRYFNSGDIMSRRSNCGPKRRSIDDLDFIRSIPKKKRQTLRALSEETNIPIATLHRYFQDGDLRRKNSSISPYLTPTNRLHRIDFVLNHIDKNGMMNDFNSFVHVDEKWFYLTEENQRYYLLPDEEVPYRTCKSKKFITKVMFLAAVARPHYCTNSNQWFNGLLGVWPFITREPALRNSKNRPSGTLVTKPLPSVNADAYQKVMIEEVLPAINSRWPLSDQKKQITIQEDNCKVHSRATRILVEAKAKESGLDIVVRPQPPNSPDFNVLDLGFFNSIQSLKNREDPKNIDELIAAVERAYWKQSRETVDNVFLSLQGAMIDSLTVDGSNSYKLRHIGKAKLRRRGELPRSLKVDPLIIARGRRVIDEPACLTATEPSSFKAHGVMDLSRRDTSPSAPLVVEEI